LRMAKRGEGQVLEKLAKWRGENHGTFSGPLRVQPLNIPGEDDLPVRVDPPGGWIPIGLRECPDCHWGTGFTFLAGNDGTPVGKVARCRCEIARCSCGARATTGEGQSSCYSIRGGGWRYTSGLVASFGRHCRDCLHKNGVRTSSYSEAIGKLPADDQAKVEGLRDKWTVQDARGKGDE
jgi:hypothetical protein